MNDLDDQRTEREYELIALSSRVMKKLKPDAARHLFHGFMQRVFMLQAGRLHLLQHADPRDRSPRGVYVSTELSLYANAYYLNLRGALDNLAWTLHFEFELIPNVNERKGRARMKVFLFSAHFLEALASHLPHLAAQIQAAHDWSTDLSERRDPAAHRIPLQIPPTVYSQADETQRKEMEALATNLMEQGRHNEGMDLMHQVESLGTFEAWLIQATSEGPQIVDLHKQVALDHDRFLALSEYAVNSLASARNVV